MATKTKLDNIEIMRLYYEHQYDRIAKLEDQRLSITNYVLTISALAFTFGFQNTPALTPINAVGLPLIIIAVNLFAIAYIDRSRLLITMHESRAREILRDYAPKISVYNDKIKHPKKGIFSGRTILQKWIHMLLIATAFIPIFLYFYQSN